MAKKNEAENTRCVLTLPLLTEPWQEHIIEKRFAIIEHLKNQLVGIELRKLKNVQRTKAYREIIDELQNNPEADRKLLFTKRRKMLQDAGISEYAFKDDMAGKNSDMQKHFAEHIAAQIAHKAASDVWRSFDKYLYGNGQEVHFHKRGTLDSVACQTAGNGMSYRDGIFEWKGGHVKGHEQIVLQIRVRPAESEYEKEMLAYPVKNMRVVRKWMKSRYKYYLQLTLDGAPVSKHRITGVGRVGIDIGTQTIAIASNKQVMLLELADRVNKNHRNKLLLQQKMDRSRRATNPDKYNPDGTVRRDVRGKFVKSKHYVLLEGKVRELERKNADIRKYQHTCLANTILSLGNEIYVEEMNYAGLQHRAKETKIDKNGRYQKKKRFGKSLANKAPAMMISILSQKAAQAGAVLNKVDTRSFTASRYDHTADEKQEVGLGDRWKRLSSGDTVQRDLYSAFLLMNSDKTLLHTDRQRCTDTFERFIELHDIEIERIKTNHTKHPSSFGC